MQEVEKLHQAIVEAEAAELASRAERNELNPAIRILDDAIKAASEGVAAANTAMEAYLIENGLEEDSVSVNGLTYRYGWEKERESVDVACKPEDLPPEFQRVKTVIEPDKVKITKALKDGELLNFAVLKRGERKFKMLGVKKTKVEM